MAASCKVVRMGASKHLATAAIAEKNVLTLGNHVKVEKQKWKSRIY